MSSPRRMTVLVTAGAEKQGLAAVRSLGRAGIRVEVLAQKPDAPAFRSRWCAERHLAPPSRDREASVQFMLRLSKRVRYATIVPCDDHSATYLSEERERFEPHTRLLLPSPDDFRRATDKAALADWAASQGLPVPRTLRPASTREAVEMAPALGLPVVIKGHHGWGAQHVRVVRDMRAFETTFEAVAALEAASGVGAPILQEYIEGVGYGFSTLFRYGEPRAVFMHRRTAEFDVAAGGTPYSCPMAEGIYDPELEALGLRLFSTLGWHGLGMAEWRLETSTGRFFLMEINPRLVGSTDLAMRSGVDLPLLYCRLAQDGDVSPVLGYRTGVRMRWLLPDTLRDLLARPRVLLDVDAWRAATDWSWRDLGPHWMQLRLAAWAVRHRH